MRNKKKSKINEKKICQEISGAKVVLFDFFPHFALNFMNSVNEFE